MHSSQKQETEEKYAPAFVRWDESSPPPIILDGCEVAGLLELFEDGAAGDEEDEDDDGENGSGQRSERAVERRKAPCQGEDQQRCVVKAVVDGDEAENGEGAQFEERVMMATAEIQK